ncbi:CHAP domain-containing protein [Streptomyces sp. SDr-06]|uniref:CHAP domain-containing protein n=1 Tax=Streptomyces sp. SDr-06 TaxID=2267702 RepID=UPI000DE962AE|nr:CHAP domain-containing protein [Streptomyces sp. SDr-06]RCH68724.1 CHAP domain-containing protein [Streptomyces sp. SDr-06]
MSGASAIINSAEAEVGYHEGRDSDGNWNNIQKYSEQVPGLAWSDGEAWCATFMSWLAMVSGNAALYPRTASCAEGVDWFRSIGRFSEYPAVGAQAFYGPGGGSHTGLVVRFDDTHIYTVEGNTNDNGSAQGDGVYRQTRRRRDDYVYGYGYPRFAEGIVSADPAYGGKSSGGSTPTPAPKPVVSLSNVVAAAETDPGASQGHQTHAADVRLVEAALHAEGLLSATYASDGSYGSSTITAYAEWQRKLGYSGSDADGIPGMTSLSKLGASHGFSVKA